MVQMHTKCTIVTIDRHQQDLAMVHEQATARSLQFNCNAKATCALIVEAYVIAHLALCVRLRGPCDHEWAWKSSTYLEDKAHIAR
jgi:hypothetical protein